MFIIYNGHEVLWLGPNLYSVCRRLDRHILPVLTLSVTVSVLLAVNQNEQSSRFQTVQIRWSGSRKLCRDETVLVSVVVAYRCIMYIQKIVYGPTPFIRHFHFRLTVLVPSSSAWCRHLLAIIS